MRYQNHQKRTKEKRNSYTNTIRVMQFYQNDSLSSEYTGFTIYIATRCKLKKGLFCIAHRESVNIWPDLGDRWNVAYYEEALQKWALW